MCVDERRAAALAAIFHCLFASRIAFERIRTINLRNMQSRKSTHEF